jgi:plastocyanin domain-containing protein
MNAFRSTDLIVIAAGLASIAWVNWYFFLAQRSAGTAATVAAGRQEITITVRGGYEPSTVRVKAGRPVRLRFDRQETAGCTEEVVFPDFALKRFLPAHEQTVIDLTPPAAGTYEFTCGMGMLHGRLVVE